MIGELLLWSLATGLVIHGILFVTSPGQLLYFLQEWARKTQLRSKWMQPVLLCHVCMPSVWSFVLLTARYFAQGGSAWAILYTWPLFALATVALTKVLAYLLDNYRLRNQWQEHVNKTQIRTPA
jgi:hypothetical protein